MEAESQSVSAEQFTINHLRQRIAKITLDHEDDLSQAAVERQLMLQANAELKKQVESLSAEVLRLESLCKENDIEVEPEDSADQPEPPA